MVMGMLKNGTPIGLCGISLLRFLRWFAYFLVVAASFFWTSHCGNLGIMPLDQSMIFDGGWRILNGQVPFKDFIMAHSPFSMIVQALFFKLLGVSWFSYVFSAAFCASLISILSMRIIFLLYGKKSFLFQLISGLLIGTSFQSLFGTLFFEQVAFLFFFLSLALLLEGIKQVKYSFVFLAGFLSLVCLLSKQNVGILCIPALCFLLCLHIPFNFSIICRRLFSFSCGVVCCFLLFLFWLIFYSNPYLFWEHAVVAALDTGVSRFKALAFFPPKLLAIISPTATICHLLGIAATLIGLPKFIGLLKNKKSGTGQLENYPILLFLPLVLVFVQCLFAQNTLNDGENMLFLSCFIFVSGTCFLYFYQRFFILQKIVILGVFAFISTFLFCEIWFFSTHRTVHDFFERGKVGRLINVDRLSGLRWMPYGPAVKYPIWSKSSPDDIEQLVVFLRSEKQPFFILGDSTYLYGVCGYVSTNPILYFVEGHFIRPRKKEVCDLWLLESLQSSNISFVVREKAMFLGDFFPKTEQWIVSNFSNEKQFGNFFVLKKRR